MFIMNKSDILFLLLFSSDIEMPCKHRNKTFMMIFHSIEYRFSDEVWIKQIKHDFSFER